METQYCLILNREYEIVPSEYISEESFDAIHKYIITKPELQGRLITLEDEFLSSETGRLLIPEFMTQILTSINKDGSCSVRMGESCHIHLKVPPVIKNPQPVQNHDVPIFLKSKLALNHLHWDLTTQQILPYIDGFNHVAKIAAEADVEINLYSNVYTAQPEIHRLAENKQLQQECIQFVARKSRTYPMFRDVFFLYSGLKPGITVKDLCLRYNPHGMKIDERKLIQFGLLKNILRRIKKYPIKIKQSEDMMENKQDPLDDWFDGGHSFDEICSQTGLSSQELDAKIEHDPKPRTVGYPGPRTVGYPEPRTVGYPEPRTAGYPKQELLDIRS
ncbi:hypothetical protein KUTeg_021201 [Tegillarca granosa]|uniref:Uncharacterized protein n=1 Tax=Tegillarca granosa TaxID=220873 RepID=A0ABQ9EA27_TEGGR|nr:hypothetical protein KUTeg_021201 [Tegillarca granosa]